MLAELSEFLETGADDLAKTIYGALVSGSYLVEPADVKPATEETVSSRKRKMSVDEPDTPVKLAKAADGQAIPTFGGGVAQAQGDGSAPMQMQMQMQQQQQQQGFPQGQGMAGAARGGMMTRGRGRGMPGRGGMVGQGQRPRGKCFDYHERGFCARGINCPYEHGPDTMYAGGPFPMGMPFSGMPGRLEEGYSPDNPALGLPNAGPTPEMFPGMMPFPMMGMPFGGMPGFPPPGQPMQGFQGGGRGRGRGRAPGRNDIPFDNWNGQLSNQPPKDNGVRTLVISEVPREHLSLDAIHSYFKQFGTVTNVAIESRASKALVAFETNAQAYAAWKSEQAVFGNRHIKVLWHKPRDGAGELGQKALDASAPLLENMRKMDQGGVEAVQSGATNSVATAAARKQELEDIKQRQVVLERNMAERKVLMKRLADGPPTPEDKKAITTRLLALVKEFSEQQAKFPNDKERLQTLLEERERAKAEVKARLERAKQAKVQADEATGVHSIQAMLDQEMETYKGKDGETEDEETIRLRAQLADLKEKASTLGVNPDANSFTPRGGHSYRGAGRGRGMGPVKSLKLDNRPKTLAVAVADGSVLQGDAADRVRSWYTDLGASDVQVDGAAVRVSFPTRSAAEQALAKGGSLPDVPPLNLAWAGAAPFTPISAARPAPAPPLSQPLQTSAQPMEQDDEEYRRGEREDDY
ncbi:hypothetical protein QFC21_007151 [Naganishia friedmannii]|uniref:Uncharacterized protein n=1 Tax=Naganishia friedmannii TaxID=89922 RepID=A0ACC2UXW7_9TREE|nr:hypothetical protein QFC21_007151 [Naganishia friedmannii]